jgi:hypothetical protein
LTLSIGIFVWTAMISFLYKDPFITIGLFTISILTLIVVITYQISSKKVE